MTTAEYLTDLVAQRDALADNLVEKGIQAEKTEKFNTLVPKVLNIQTGNPETELFLKAIIERDVDYLGQIELPDGITSIASYLFYGCNNLQLDTIPSSVTSIGEAAFYDCNNLNPTSLPDTLISIGHRAFYDCDNLALTELPDSVETIGDYAFNNCVKLALDKLPDNLTSIGSYGFYGCRELEITTVPQGVKSLNMQAFGYCVSMERFSSETVTQMGGASVFVSCTALQEVYLPNLWRLEIYLFNGCTSLKKVTIGTARYNSGANTFRGANALEELIIGDGWTLDLYLNYNSKITQACVHQIIEKFADMTGKTSPKFTVHANCTAIDQEHLDLINAKNWEHNLVLEEVAE